MNLTINSDEIYNLIEAIAQTPSKNEKQRMLKACEGCELLREVLKAACDPTISYGIKKIPPHLQIGLAIFDAQTWSILRQMQARTLTGNAMMLAVQAELNRLSNSSASLFKRILLKDLRAGFAESTTNKVFPGLIPEYPYMRCSLPKDAKLEAFYWSAGVISQEKADGMFANVNHEATGEVFIYSRSGSMFPMKKFESLVEAVQSALDADTQSHGELLIRRSGEILPREIGNGILNSVLKGGDFGPDERPIFMIWDQIPLSAVRPKGKYEVPYRTRLTAIANQLRLRKNPAHRYDVQLVPTRIIRSLPDAYQHYAELLAEGKEGTIVKNPTAIWRDATSKGQVKLKLDFAVDLQIIGFEAGKGKNESTFGSIITATSDGKLEVSVSGFKDATRAEIWANGHTIVGTVMTVRANGIMKPSQEGKAHSLFLPRFVEFRLDKKVADTLQQVFDQEEAAKQGAALLKEAA